jgi:small-conductance mechanosensitive channel
MGASFVVTVGYECDVAEVERVLGDVFKGAVGEVAGLLAEPAPNVTFDPGFGENGIGMTMNYQVAEFANQFPVRNELKKRAFLSLREAGIMVPYATRTLYLRGGGGREKRMKPQGGEIHQ